MTEEQRYRERIQLEKDKVQLLKRIAEALEIIAAPYNAYVSREKLEDLADRITRNEIEAPNKVYKKEKFSKDDIVDPFKLPD